MELEKDLTVIGMVLGVVLILAAIVYQPYHEKEVFNKFKDPNQPDATYIDAVFSRLRITTK